MIDNKNIFSCEEMDHERSQEGSISDKIFFGIGVFALAFSLYVYVIVPLFKNSSIGKKLAKMKEKKEKELREKEYKEYKEKQNEDRKAFEEIKNHPQINFLKSETNKIVVLADKLGKSVVPILEKRFKTVDINNYLEFVDCSENSDRHDDISEILWGKCIEVAKAIKEKTSIDVFVEIFSFSVYGLKQYTLDEETDDEENTKFMSIFDNTIKEQCKKLAIPMIDVYNNKSEMKPNTIYYDKYWAGDHHGTTQALVETIHLDFSK